MSMPFTAEQEARILEITFQALAERARRPARVEISSDQIRIDAGRPIRVVGAATFGAPIGTPILDEQRIPLGCPAQAQIHETQTSTPNLESAK